MVILIFTGHLLTPREFLNPWVNSKTGFLNWKNWADPAIQAIHRRVLVHIRTVCESLAEGVA